MRSSVASRNRIGPNQRRPIGCGNGLEPAVSQLATTHRRDQANADENGISLRCASMRRKIALNSLGIWGMSAKMASQLDVSCLSRAPGVRTGANETRQGLVEENGRILLANAKVPPGRLRRASRSAGGASKEIICV
jgi:hypothetical protein